MWICKYILPQYHLQQNPTQIENLWKPPVDCLNGDYPTSIFPAMKSYFRIKNQLIKFYIYQKD